MKYCPTCGKPVKAGAAMDTRDCKVTHYSDDIHSWTELVDKSGGPTQIKEDTDR